MAASPNQRDGMGASIHAIHNYFTGNRISDESTVQSQNKMSFRSGAESSGPERILLQWNRCAI